MNKKFFVLLIAVTLLFSFNLSGAELKAKQVAAEAVKKSSISDSISYIKKQIEGTTTASEKRAMYILLASLQEQMAYYEDAQKSYASAASISAGAADGMSKKTNEQLVLDAVRCSLCCGDFNTANSYLNSSVRNSKNADVISYVKLYSQWSALTAANSTEDLQEPIEVLKAYLKVDSMKKIQPAILLTLWYVTGEVSYSKTITSDFPKSTEAAIVKGDVQLLPAPFWFFVPKSGVAEQGTGTFSSTEEPKTETKTEEKQTVAKKYTKWQLGLFKTENNAKLLCEEVKGKGFDASVTTETRASGTTYYIVTVKEDSKGNVSDRLRSAGYECYPVD